jgi:hypothetical protein
MGKKRRSEQSSLTRTLCLELYLTKKIDKNFEEIWDNARVTVILEVRLCCSGTCHYVGSLV